jgi:hypothetical protein
VTNRALASLDADLHAAFRDAGLADVALYTPAEASAATVVCRVYVDDDLTTAGFVAEVSSASVLIRALRADLPSLPTAGAVFAIGNDRYVVDRIVAQDSSAVTCLAAPERCA